MIYNYFILDCILTDGKTSINSGEQLIIAAKANRVFLLKNR